MARMTLYGMMQYDPSLFDNIVLPDGIDKDCLIAEIVQHSGDLYPYYQVPPFLKVNISYWFMRRRFDFEQMYKALNTDYNPLENYDRYEDLSHSVSDKTNVTDSSTMGNTTTVDYGSVITDTRSDTATEAVSAYDASDYQNRNKRTQTGTTGSNRSGSDQNTTSGNTSGQSDTDRKLTESNTNHIHGNIGVTTASAMIKETEEMRYKYDLYRMIAEMFEREFITQIY